VIIRKNSFLIKCEEALFFLLILYSIKLEINQRKKDMNKLSIRVVFIGIILLGFAVNMQAQLQLLSGLSGGTYQSLAQDIKNHSSQKINVLTSSGSVDNYNQLISNDNSNFLMTFAYVSS